MDKAELRDLDARIAVRYFGWQWYRSSRASGQQIAVMWPPEDGLWIRWNFDPAAQVIASPDGYRRGSDWDRLGTLKAQAEHGALRFLPHFASDLNAMWLLIQRLQGRYWWEGRTPFDAGDPYHVAGFTRFGATGWNGRPDFQGFGMSLPHATALAALAIDEDA